MLTALIWVLLGAQNALPEVEPADDLVIDSPVRIKPGVYRIPDEGKPGVLHVAGDDVLVYMEGVTLLGAGEEDEPDSFTGTGIVVKGKRALLQGGTVRGFKVGVHVDGGEDHWLMELDVGGNFAQRLRSTPKKEDPGDWLWPHTNDEGEWARRYGAGILVRDANRVRILGCVGRGSQNGILLERTTRSLVRGCDFSYNSGWGIALWRSSDNRVEQSDFDWCVRGYSHGVYARGQDSAGILVFEQCHRNRFVENSATHGGDGFFLYAGHETTKETGEGGCNDNLVEGNDFSHAVANGIEATFSTGNRFLDNRMDDCNYGIWAGYSRMSVFRGNVIRDCSLAGIAIEHGSENVIEGNLIENSVRGVRLWWDEDEEFLESVYGKENRTDSADTVIRGNLIRRGEAGVHLTRSERIEVVGNLFEGLKRDRYVVTEGECPGLEIEHAEEPFVPDLRQWIDDPGVRRGREFILVGEWGPYDFSTPMLHPDRVEGAGSALFRVLGAGERVDVVEVEGEVSVTVRGEVDRQPELFVTALPEAPSYVPFTVRVKTAGEELTASGALLRTRWRTRFWRWETDPREDPKAWTRLLGSPPALEIATDSIDFRWQGLGPGRPLGRDRFATLAESKIELPAGTWEIVVNSDDGVRVSVDDRTVLENWTHHGPTEDRATITLEEGVHVFRIEHFELDGWAWLTFAIRRVD